MAIPKNRVDGLTFEKKTEIIEYFKKTKDNRSVLIAEHFGLTVKQVDTVINTHFTLAMRDSQKQMELDELEKSECEHAFVSHPEMGNICQYCGLHKY